MLGKTALITGGGGLLGPEHGIGLAKHGAAVVLIDIDEAGLRVARQHLLSVVPSATVKTGIVDITDETVLTALMRNLQKEGHAIDILVNNAAINPKMDVLGSGSSGKVENYDMDLWTKELRVGITGTFLCCKVFGHAMASRGKGVIVNISSDAAIIAPDQRVYSKTGLIEDVQHFKPIGYSVIKAAMLGLNRYLATYWAHKGVRVNCLVPGAVFNQQPEHLVKQVQERIPLRRWAEKNEYQEALAFLASDASSYMTGQTLVMDGGRSIW